MPPLAPSVSQAGLLRTQSGWNNSSLSRRSNTTRGLLSTRTPQSMDTTSGGLLNPPLPPSAPAVAMPRGATGSFRPRISLRRPDTGRGSAYVLNRVTGQRAFIKDVVPTDLNNSGFLVVNAFSDDDSGVDLPKPFLGDALAQGGPSFTALSLATSDSAVNYPAGFVSAINNSNDSVGAVSDVHDVRKTLPAYWTALGPESPPTPLLLTTTVGIQYTSGDARNINDNGAIVGYVRDVSDEAVGPDKPAYWASRTSNVTILSLTDGTATYDVGVAQAINSNGAIVGYVRDVSDEGVGPDTPAYWPPGPDSNVSILSLTDGTTNYTAGEAQAINSDGKIVGYVENSDGVRLPAYWASSTSSNVTVLNRTPAEGGTEYTSAQVLGISSDGAMVGHSIDTIDVALLWTDAAADPQALPGITLGGVTSGNAVSISDNGSLVLVFGDLG